MILLKVGAYFRFELRLEYAHEKTPDNLSVSIGRVRVLFPGHGTTCGSIHVAGLSGRNGVLGAPTKKKTLSSFVIDIKWTDKIDGESRLFLLWQCELEIDGSELLFG